MPCSRRRCGSRCPQARSLLTGEHGQELATASGPPGHLAQSLHNTPRYKWTEEVQHKHRGQRDEVVCEGSASMTEEQHKVVSDAMRNSLDASGPPTVKRKKLDPQTKQLTQDHPARKSPLRAAPGQTLGSPSHEWTPYRGGEHPVGPRGNCQGHQARQSVRACTRSSAAAAAAPSSVAAKKRSKRPRRWPPPRRAGTTAARPRRGSWTGSRPRPLGRAPRWKQRWSCRMPSGPAAPELVGLLHTGSCAPGDPHVSAVSS